MKKYLWKFHWDCGRSGDVRGLFVATKDEIEAAIGKEVYFGEILGKHSEVSGTLEKNEVTKVDLDSETVEKVQKVLGRTWSGYNPLSYIRYYCSDCGDVVDEEDMLGDTCRYCHAENSSK